jgi:methyl-accepting chemotaxis protein
MDKKSKAHQIYVLELETELHEFEQREEATTRKMQLLMYLVTVVFVVLSAYGFSLVSSLTKDVSRMANLMATMNNTVDTHMKIISTDTVGMSNNMAELMHSTQNMNEHVSHLTLQTKKMSQNVRQMSLHTGHMQQDLWSLNKHISKPLNLFNTFIP